MSLPSHCKRILLCYSNSKSTDKHSEFVYTKCIDLVLQRWAQIPKIKENILLQITYVIPAIDLKWPITISWRWKAVDLGEHAGDH